MRFEQTVWSLSLLQLLRPAHASGHRQKIEKVNKMSERMHEWREKTVFGMRTLAQGMYHIYIDSPVALIDGTTSTLILPPFLFMSSSLLCCIGCNKVFIPHGHSQHTSKTCHQSCRNSQGAVTFRSIPPSQMGSSLARYASPESLDMSGGADGDTFARAYYLL